MIRYLNRLYWLAYVGAFAILALGLHFLFGLKADDAATAALLVVATGLILAHAAFHGTAFALSYSVRQLPQIKDKRLHFHQIENEKINAMIGWDWVKAVFYESLDTLEMTLLNMPWRSKIDDLYIADKQWRKNKPLPVLLLHGYMCNSGVWVKTRQRLEKAGVSHMTITLEPAIGSIRKYPLRIHNAILELKAKTGAPQVKIICHSMGGVALRYYATEYGHNHVAAAITLGSPHYGTALSLLGVGKNVKQMAWGSFFLRTLREHPRDVDFQKKIISVWTAHDTIVSPPTSCKLEFAQNIMLQGCGHMYLMHHPETVALIEDWLRADAREYVVPAVESAAL
ncbi:MAG: alpha/beta hydrolase [Limnobacter sp.]|nr:alpha/beta hydrolase [Limnobacter sp.]